MTTAPMPPRLGKAKAAAVTVAAMGVTAALTFGATTMASEALLSPRNATAAVSAPLTKEQAVDLLASIGIYPIGPGAQIARLFGAGTPQDALRTMGLIAGLIPGETGTNLQASLQAIAAALEAAQDGLEVLPEGTLPDIPEIDLDASGFPWPLNDVFADEFPEGIHVPALPLNEGLTLAFPEIKVPQFGPAGTYDAVAGLEGDVSTQLLLTLLKNLQSGTNLLPSDVLPPPLDAIIDFIKVVPLNVPGDRIVIDVSLELLFTLDLDLFFSSASKLAILPSFGLGGTNTAFVAPYFLKEGEFADTAVLAIPIRNTSRPGGGIVALLNPLSSLVGVNLANVDGREGNGNVTFWDVTAAYDILSDAPSTVFNPVAWANAATGALMPTYLIPQNVEAFAGVIEDVVSGNISLETITALLASGDIATLFHTESGEDGNLYITYDSGNLPLLEPFQFLPRTISYLPGFDISTPVSESFNDVLTQLVAMGYQDVNLVYSDGDPGQVPSFVRGWDQAGTQAEFWTSPVSFEDGLQVPQALFNALIGDGVTTGLTGNLLNPEAQDLTLFGSSAIGDAVYKNVVSVAVAGFLRDALLELKEQLNPIFDAVDSNDAVVSIAKGLDDAVDEINGVIGQGGDAIKGQGINLADPIMDANRGFNNLVGGTTVPDLAEAANLRKSTALGVDVSQRAAPGAGLDVNDQLAGEVEDKEATSIAGSLKQQRETLRAGVEKRKTELENRLTKRADDGKRVTDKLRSGDIGGAAEEAGKNVQQRVERVSKDIENGVKKVTGRHRKAEKAEKAA